MSKLRQTGRFKLAILVILLFAFATTVFAQNYYVDALGRVHQTGLFIGGVQVTSNAAELNVLDGIPAGLTAAELGVLDGIPAGLTAAELGILDGVTSNAAELNVLDGIAAGLTAAELSVLDGIAAGLTAAELSILDGVTATTAEINVLAGIAAGLTAAELSVLDGIAAGLTAAELSILDGVTATTAELNVLAGVPAGLTNTEIGYMDGVTAGVQGQLNAKIETSDWPGFLYGVTLSFTDNSANYSVQPTITGHEMIVGIRNTVSGAVTWCKSTTAKTGAIAGIAANTVYYVHAAPSAGDFTITVNTTSTETGDDFIIGEYRTEQATAEIAHSENYGPIKESDTRPKVVFITNTADASGNQTLECDFIPKFILLFGDNVTETTSSFGFSDGTTHGCVHMREDGGWDYDTNLFQSVITGSTMSCVVIFVNNGAILTWAETGTGNNVEYKALIIG